MATTYDQQQQGSANKDLAQKNEAKVPAGQGAEVINAAHGSIANTFAKAESEKTNKQGQSNDPYSTFNYYWTSYTVPKTGKTQTLSGEKLGSSYFGKVNGQFIKDMTIAQLQELSPDKYTKNFTISYTDGDPDKNVTGRLFALGRYQIIPGTLKDLLAKPTLTKNGITKDSKFSEQVQDLCYSSFLKDKGFRTSVGKYLENKTVDDKLLEAAARELAQHWASIGIKPKTPAAPPKKGKKQIYGADNGRTSYYEGDGLNHAHISYNQIVAALKADREAVQSGRMAIQTTASGLAAQGASKATGAADNTAKADTASDKAAANTTAPQNVTAQPTSNNAGTTGTPAAALSYDQAEAIKYNEKLSYTRTDWINIQGKLNAVLSKRDKTTITTDGLPGGMTADAIYNFQEIKGLSKDGMLGPDTQTALGVKKASAKKTSSATAKGSTQGLGEIKDGGQFNSSTVNYKQSASPWGPKIYGSTKYSGHGTYSAGGCGPSSLANVITKLSKTQTPEDIGRYIWKNGGVAWRPAEGATADPAVPGVCKGYGVSCKRVQTVEEGLSALTNGKYAVACMGKGAWTKKGHFITPYAYKNGVVYADTSSSRNSGGTQDASSFKKEIRVRDGAPCFWIIG